MPSIAQSWKILYSYNESNNYKFDPIIYEDGLMPRKNISKACNEVRIETKNVFKGINFYGILNKCPSNNTTLELKKEFDNIDDDIINSHSEQKAFKNMINNRINKKYLKITEKIEFLKIMGTPKMMMNMNMLLIISLHVI